MPSKSGDAAADAIPLDSLTAAPAPTKQKGGTGRLINFKILVAVFMIFIIIVSDVFTNSVVSGFKGAVKCRSVTSYGIVIQGIFLVLFYILAIHLIAGGVI